MTPFPKPANHPPSCRICDGTGWQPAKPVTGQAAGHQVTYRTREPCGNDWYTEDPTVDRYGLDMSTPIPFAQYLAQLTARLERHDRAAELEWAGWQQWGARIGTAL